jgi:hypothetical protein
MAVLGLVEAMKRRYVVVPGATILYFAVRLIVSLVMRVSTSAISVFVLCVFLREFKLSRLALKIKQVVNYVQDYLLQHQPFY